MSNLTRRDQRQWEDPVWAVRSVRKSLFCRDQRKSHKEGPACGRIPYGRAFGKKEFILPGSAQNPIRKESHKEGPACGRIPYEQSHKEGPTSVGGSLVGGAFGEKESIMPGTAQNESKKMRGCCRFCSGLFLTDTAF